jgi:hypothetical protein
MSMTQAISVALQHAFDMDTPQDLLPLTITQDACMLAGFESDRMGCASWAE